VIGQKISTKSIVEALNRYKKHSPSKKNKDKAGLFLENGLEKILEQSAVEQD